MKNLYLFFCIICLMLSGIANSSANTFDFSSLKLNDRPHVLLSKVAVPTPKITASSTTICKGSKVTLTATACTNGVLKWTDGLEGNSITVSPVATKSYRVLCKLNSAPAGSPTMSDSSTAVKITVNPIPVAPKITSNTYCNNPVSVLGDISFGGDNTDYLSSTCIAKDGALIMIGYSASSNTGDKSQASKGGSDYWVVKVNATGTKVWDKTFGGTGDDVPLSIIATSDGGFLISGYSNSPKSGDKSEASKGGYDYWLVKIDANGTKVWDKSFGGSGSDFSTGMIATSDNNFLLIGHSDSEIGGNKSVGTKGSLDYWIVKIKPDGTKIWDKAYGGPGVDNLVSIVSTKEGGFLLAGHSSSLAGGDKTESSKGNYDYWILKIDANGTKIWDKSYGASSQEELSTIAPTFDGGYILGGISNSKAGGDKIGTLLGGFDYWIVKVNADGTKLWDKVFGGSDTEYFAKVLPTADGGCLLGGTSYSKISGNKSETSVNGDFWLVKLTADGSKAWDKVVGGNSADVLKDMFLSENGRVVLNGYSFSDAGSSKRQPSKGSSDYWTVYTQVCDNSYKPYTNLVATGCTGVVTWSNNATGSTITVSPSVATNFTATCSVNGCVSVASNSITVNPPKPATPSIAASSTSVCAGSPVVLSSSNSLNGTITWTGGTKGSSITIYPTATKVYKSVCNVNGINSDSSNSITITVLPKPTQPKITVTNSSICIGSSTTLTASACTGGVTTWTGGLTGSSITVFPTKTTIYKALCTVNTCRSDSSVATTITVIAKPSQPKITASNSTICAGSSTTLTSTACTGGVLTWTGGVTGSSITVSPTTPQSYRVLCTQGTCKSDSSVATTITVIAKPSQPKITASNSTICAGSSVTLTSTACTGGTLTWTGGATGSSITVSPSVTKSYKVLCTQGTCKSDSSVATTITVIAKPSQPKITASNSTICAGSSVTLTSTACTGGTLTWTGGATGSSITVSPTATKSYKVLCTQGTCKSDSSVATTITVIAKPTHPKITASNNTICSGSSVTLTSTACTGGTLTWTGGLTGTSITVSPNTTKAYRVLCTQSGCKSDSSTAVKITVNPIPVAPKITSNTYCNNPVSVLGDISFGGDNTDYLSSTCIAKDGALIMIGYSSSSNTGDKSQASKGGSDYWVVKVNATGTKVWDKTFGGTGDDVPLSIIATSDGGFLISGYSNSSKSGDKSEASKGGYDYWLVKIDANGTKVWDKSFGGSGSDYANSIIATSDNNFLITGHSDSEIGGNKSVGTKGSLDYWIVKIKPDGTKIWDKAYGGPGVDNLVSIVSTKEGGFLLAGHSNSLAGGDKTESTKGSSDYWLVKIDANGTKIWDKSYGASSQEELSTIAATFDGGFILGGISNSSIGGDKTEPLMGGFDYWIVKINADGTKLWDKVFGGSDTEYFAKVLPTADGGCLLGGTSYSPISGNKFEASVNGDYWLVKLSANGSRAWDKVVGGNSADVLKDMFLSDDAKVILNGYSFSDAGSSKRQPSQGSSDYWTVFTQVCDNSYKPYTNLVATGCTGVVTWSNNATGSTITVSPSVATNFTATCSVNGCVSVASNSITVNPPKPATPSIAASSTSVCEGSPVVLSSSNSLNGTITWTGGTKGSSITIYPTATKVYKSVCNVNGINSDSSNSITITVLPKPTQPKITVTNSSICIGSSTTLTASACIGGVTTWTGGLTGNSITVSPSATKSYKVLCTVNSCKSDSSVASTITVTTKPQAPVISSKINYISNTANAQWNKTFGGVGEENITSIIACTDGGALLGGYSMSNVSLDKSESSKGVYDYWIIRIDADGKKLWDKTLGGANYDYLTSIVTNADGGFLLGGYSLSNKSGDKSENSKGDKDYWVVKIDKNGQKIWDKTYGGLFADVLTSITSTSDGGFLLGGHSLSYVGGDKTETNKGNHDYWLVKIDANGNKLWDKTFGGASNDYFYGMTTTSDGGFLLGGYSTSNKSGDKSENIKGWHDYWIVKIDAKGNKVWDKTIGGDGGDALSSLINTSDDGFLLTGSSSSNQSGDKSANAKGNADYWIVKIDASGNKLWDKTFGGNSLDQLNAVFKTSDGGFLLGGYSQSSINGDKTENTKGNYDYWVVRIDASGNKLWDKTFGGNDNDQFSAMTLMKDGSFLLGGNSNSKASYDKSENAKGGFDYWLIKIKENQIKSTTSLTATGCTGTVNWSNGATTNSITVSPTVATTYTATCTVNTCKSAVSNAITVSPDVVPNGRVGSDIAIESEPSFNFKVFPNPAKDELMIQTDLEGEATFHLYNSIGQSVLEKTFEKQTKIDLKNLSKGSHYYFIQHQEIRSTGKVLLE
ncbi:Ig-like domain-containing protein [Arcicella rigui]|uniref:T9SS type A sorting domain-containing protein n=1 Tax=Arcicella rigui TaxID=797020 RepID=A0ABU5QA19_9BACT|nr:T9SS type A sorting domain-containing protein [Arcicella rigui]MEA5139568.1 T9SS type A sorting domain-containing protein [Arcicella rigui]